VKCQRFNTIGNEKTTAANNIFKESEDVMVAGDNKEYQDVRSNQRQRNEVGKDNSSFFGRGIVLLNPAVGDCL
jgi:hypothetical protein